MRNSTWNFTRPVSVGALTLLVLCACGGGGGGDDGGPTQPRPPVAVRDTATTIEAQPVTINDISNRTPTRGVQSFAFAPARPY